MDPDCLLHYSVVVACLAYDWGQGSNWIPVITNKSVHVQTIGFPKSMPNPITHWSGFYYATIINNYIMLIIVNWQELSNFTFHNTGFTVCMLQLFTMATRRDHYSLQ